MKFIDEVDIFVRSGRGGPGAVSFRREYKVPRGGPDGGDGGAGGHVIFRASPRVQTLLDLKFRKRILAQDGRAGGGQNCTGADGMDAVIEVPVGTVLKTEAGEILADLANPQDLIFLKGGRGGKGNSFFKGSVNQAPRFAQPGEEGSERQLRLEIRLIADVGIIGLPNAGKSTLISRISAARPKIADYPFTTLVPNLGVVRLDEERSFVVADVPGLIKGAHSGTGLGHQFLRHVERTRILIHLIDATEADPLESYQIIQEELGLYDHFHETDLLSGPLLKRTQVVALNKVEALTPEALVEVLEKFRGMGIPTSTISAVTGAGIQDLIYLLGRHLFAKKE